MVSCTHGQRLGGMAIDQVRVRDGAFQRALGLAAMCFSVLVLPQSGSASEAVNLSADARAASKSATPIEEKMDGLVVTLIAWIVGKTELPAPSPPRIILLSRLNMIAKYHGTEDASRYLKLQAFYSPIERTIYLPDTWTSNEVYGRSVLLHELVHHVQRSANVPTRCPVGLEPQAFELQAAWLREQGVASPYEMIGTDEFTVRVLYSCLDD